MTVDLLAAAARVEQHLEGTEIGPGDLVVATQHSITKAASRGLDPFNEIGTTGLRQFGGYVLEEWLSTLQGRRAAWVWREMLDNDPVVGAIMFAIKWLARNTPWTVQEGNDARAAELIESAMNDMSHTWGDFISEALSMLPYGWAFHETVYKRRQGPQPEPPWSDKDEANDTSENTSYAASSKYNDGLIGWRKMPIRAQETLLRWGFDGYSGIRYMEQIDWHGGDHKIPLQKALLFRTQTTRNNPEGRAILRNAFTSYWALKNIKQIEAIGIERDLAGIPVATPPEGVDLFAPGQSALLAKVQKMVTAIRRDEYEGVVMPSAGWKLELLSTAGSRQFDTDKVIRRYRQDIALSMLADFVLIGQDSVGSYAMVDVKSDLFGVALDGIFDLMCEVFNAHAIPRLLKLNGMDVSDPPKIVHGSAAKLDLERVGSFLQAISLAGAPIPWSMELLRSLFTEAGLPAQFNEYQPAKDLPGQDANLNTQESVESETAQATQDRARGSAVQKSGSVTGSLQARFPGLSEQLEREIAALLAELGESASSAYLAVVTKASGQSRSTLYRIVGRVIRALNLQQWIETRLIPILRNHAGRVTADTKRVISTEIDLEVHVADQDAERIAQQAGKNLRLRDIEPQVRKAIMTAIQHGLAAGDNPDKTAQRIKEMVPAGRFTTAGAGYRAQLISRSETADTQRAATLALYRSNPRIKAVRLRDGIYGPPRSDAQCIGRDGEVVPIDDVPDSNHAGCTLSYEAVIGSA